MAKVSKRQADAAKALDNEKLYGLAEAVQFLKERASPKFDETLEMAINLGVDPRPGAEHALHDRELAHLQAEEEHRRVVVHPLGAVRGGVIHQVEDEGRLPHRWSRRDDRQLTGVEAAAAILAGASKGTCTSEPAGLAGALD